MLDYFDVILFLCQKWSIYHMKTRSCTVRKRNVNEIENLLGKARRALA